MNGNNSMSFPVDGTWIHATEAKLGVHFSASFVASMAKMKNGAVDFAMLHVAAAELRVACVPSFVVPNKDCGSDCFGSSGR